MCFAMPKSMLETQLHGCLKNFIILFNNDLNSQPGRCHPPFKPVGLPHRNLTYVTYTNHMHGTNTVCTAWYGNRSE